MRISDWSSDVCSSDLKRVSLWLRGFVRKNSDQPPAQRFARVEGDDFADAVGDDRLAAFQRQRAGVERQAVEAWAVLAREAFEMGQRAILVERLEREDRESQRLESR